MKAIAVGPGDVAAAKQVKAAAVAAAAAAAKDTKASTVGVLTPRSTRQATRTAVSAAKADAKHVRNDSALENMQPKVYI